MQEFLEQQLHAQYPDAAIEEVEDYNMFSPTGTIVGGYLRLKRQHILPIKTYKAAGIRHAESNHECLVESPRGAMVSPCSTLWRSARREWRSLGNESGAQHEQRYDFYRSGQRGHEAVVETRAGWLAKFLDRHLVVIQADSQQPRQLSQAEQTNASRH